MGEQDVLVAPPIILLGGTTSLPVPAPMKQTQAPNATFFGEFSFSGEQRTNWGWGSCYCASIANVCQIWGGAKNKFGELRPPPRGYVPARAQCGAQNTHDPEIKFKSPPTESLPTELSRASIYRRLSVYSSVTLLWYCGTSKLHRHHHHYYYHYHYHRYF